MKYPRLPSRSAAAAAATVLLALSGCAGLDDYRAPRVDMPSTAPVQPQAMPAVPVVANGSIFQGATYRPLFEDHRARLVGDTLTVQIVEAVSASQKSTSSVDKSGKVDASVSALPILGSGSIVGKLGAGADASNTFAGKGATESSNDFSGTITAMVTGVLPNGHLLITGEKQIGVNANVDVLRFAGQVDPRAIQPGNVVPSSRIANVRVEHRSRGQQADAQLMGLLGRVFLSVLPF
ncbi:flagellar basal body L-ring protein FlgH [Azohydromonas lata]|uniref:Flagellar L-ring protein n=1 Tax=Azohydromonas lata TaxID=45677 RepID=A0ABU5IFE5_9BURK|nr:flagellar basal body L-ring protein FlgH [Azohydromonas lata]MDZ5457266.1 flagellar basal body L-ring protein FlgH [Azohydromonas lata]